MTGSVQDRAIKLFERFARSEYEVLRLRAVQAIRDTGARECNEILRESLDDDDEDVRIDAAETLGKFGDVSATSKLLEHLIHDPSGDVKLTCVNALAELEAKQAIPILRELVTGRGDGIEWDENEFHQDGWDIWLDIQPAAIRALTRLKDNEAIDLICEAIKDPEGQDIDTIGFDALASFGKESVKHLSEFANSTSRHQRYCAIRAISRIDDTSAINLLETATNDEDPSIRALAYEVLLEKEQYSKLIDQAISDNSEDVRLIAISKADLSDSSLLNKILTESNFKMQNALIQKFDCSICCDDKNDLSFKILEFLSNSKDVEVASNAFGTLAARSTELVRQRLEELFIKQLDSMEDLERRQWSVTDKFSKSNHPMALKWLKHASESKFKVVRLKALAILGEKLGKEKLDSKLRLEIKELLINVAKDCMHQSDATQLESENDQQEKKMDETEEVNEKSNEIVSNMATSSLDEILKSSDSAIRFAEMAASMEKEDLLTENTETELPISKLTLERKNVDSVSNKNDFGIDGSKLAIQFMGDHSDMQDILIDLFEKKHIELSVDIMTALNRSISKFGIAVDSERIRKVILEAIALKSTNVSVQAIQLIGTFDQICELLEEILLESSTSEESLIRSKSIEVKCSLDGHAESAVKFLYDSSPMVRQKSMKILAKLSPELAKTHFVEFLIGNPDISVDEYFGNDIGICKELCETLIDSLESDEFKSTWPAILTALSTLQTIQRQQSV